MNKYEEALQNIGDLYMYDEDGEIDCLLSESFVGNDFNILKELVDNYEKLMKAFDDGKVLIKLDYDEIGIFECEADIWATIGNPIVRLE